MMTHSAIARLDDGALSCHQISFSGDAWLDYVPLRAPDAIDVGDRLPPGAAAELINRAHTDKDICLPIDARDKRLVDLIDGTRRLRDMIVNEPAETVRALFEKLWWHDQVVFDASRRSPSV
jgi:hypothetical protein